jgi:hypothetical protein
VAWWIAGVTAVLLAARLLTVDGVQGVRFSWIDYRLPELCSFRRMFGADCPGCGMTRSFIYASRFQWMNAWMLNPAGTLLFLSLALSIPLRLVQWTQARRGDAIPSTLSIEAGCLVVIALVMMLNWGYKFCL